LIATVLIFLSLYLLSFRFVLQYFCTFFSPGWTNT